MRNVSDAGVKALAEAGCGSGLRTLILGAVWQYLCPGYCGLCVACGCSHLGVLGWLCCGWVRALPRENLCGMVCVLSVVVSCHMMLS